MIIKRSVNSIPPMPFEEFIQKFFLYNLFYNGDLEVIFKDREMIFTGTHPNHTLKLTIDFQKLGEAYPEIDTISFDLNDNVVVKFDKMIPGKPYTINPGNLLVVCPYYSNFKSTKENHLVSDIDLQIEGGTLRWYGKIDKNKFNKSGDYIYVFRIQYFKNTERDYLLEHTPEVIKQLEDLIKHPNLRKSKIVVTMGYDDKYFDFKNNKFLPFDKSYQEASVLYPFK